MGRITINNADDLKAFIEAQKVARQHACGVFTASRAALRCLPYAINFFQHSDFFVDRNINCLVILRRVLVAANASVASSPKIVGAAENARGAYPAHFDATRVGELNSSSSNAAYFAATAAAFKDNVSASIDVAIPTVQLAESIGDTIWSETSRDLELWLGSAETEVGTLPIDASSLWSGENPLERDWHTLREKLLAADTPDPRGADWSFWVKWYDDILAGNPQNWDMLHEIATTDAIDWDAPSREVNDMINQIVERYRLRDEVVALRREVEQLRSAIQYPPRNHNNPPELVADAPEVQEQLTIIWAAAQEAEEELEKPKPDPTILSKAGQIILDFGIWFAKYCGHISNFAFKAVITASLGSASVYYLKNDTHLIAELGKHLLDFASRLGVL